MEWITKGAWLGLALVHMMPAVVLFVPQLTERLYAVSATGETGVLLVHRGALFLAIVVAALYAVLDPNTRRLASIVVVISVVGFLLVYARSGYPAGSLRMIAWVDMAALIPLAWVIWSAWFDGSEGN